MDHRVSLTFRSWGGDIQKNQVNRKRRWQVGLVFSYDSAPKAWEGQNLLPGSQPGYSVLFHLDSPAQLTSIYRASTLYFPLCFIPGSRVPLLLRTPPTSSVTHSVYILWRTSQHRSSLFANSIWWPAEKGFVQLYTLASFFKLTQKYLIIFQIMAKYIILETTFYFLNGTIPT